jgi:hypothetical protein
MPNIQQLIALRDKYKVENNISTKQLTVLNETFNLSAEQIKNSFSYNGIDNRMLSFFEDQKSAEVVMLFIDISNFSNICKSFPNSTLATYLDQYYDKVIPLIYRHGGEVEKIIGDGIIAIFGQPFLDLNHNGLLEKADLCAKDIIIDLEKGYQEVKIAYHEGTIMYYKNKTLNYPEYTMIGKPLTELFRLESVAKNNSITFFDSCTFDTKPYSSSKPYCRSTNSPVKCKYFTKSISEPVSLQGVDHKNIKHLTCKS